MVKVFIDRFFPEAMAERSESRGQGALGCMFLIRLVVGCARLRMLLCLG